MWTIGNTIGQRNVDEYSIANVLFEKIDRNKRSKILGLATHQISIYGNL